MWLASDEERVAVSGTEVPETGAPTLASGPTLTFEQLVEVGVQAAQALHHLHAQGRIFGPLSAANVVLTEPVQVVRHSNSAISPQHKQLNDVQQLAQALIRPMRLSPEPAAALLVATTAQQLELAFGAMRKGTDSTRVSTPGATGLEEPDLTGQLLGPWGLQQFIAEGAMGRVYLAKHTRIGRVAAVKVLKREHAVRADLVQRFIQEAQAVNAIRNEHIVEVYDFGEQSLEGGERRVYCIMELLQGQSLADAVERQKFSVPRAARIARQMALALHAAHSVGVIHRDIKPDNIFLTTRDGADYVKVLDFGIAKLLKPIGELPMSGTQAGTIIGTPEYMAPEQALGEETSARSDIYAVGLVLFELLSGRPPFQGASFGQLVVDITSKPFPVLPTESTSGDRIPPQLVAVIKKATARQAVDRYTHANELAEALEPFTTRESLSALPTVSGEEPGVDSDAALRSLRPSAWPKILGALGVVLLVAIGLWASQGGETEKPVTAVTPVTPKAPVAPEAPVVQVPAEVSLTVESNPAGAEVKRSDTQALLGVTPLTLKLPANEELKLSARLNGFQPVERVLPMQADTVVTFELTPLPKVEVPVKPVQTRPLAPLEKKPKQGPSDKNTTVDPFNP